MKKIIAIIVILIIVVIGVLGVCYVNKNNSSISSSKQVQETKENSSAINKNNEGVKNSNNESNNQNTSNQNLNSDNYTSINKLSNKQNSGNNRISVPINTLNSTKNSIKQDNSNNSNGYVPSTKLSNGPVTDVQLAGIMRKWLLKDQYSYSRFFDAVGTMWAKPWLDNIPNSKLIGYFKQVNGINSLNSAITAKELFDASKPFTYEQEKKPIPFTTEQATQYIIQMLKQCGYYSDVTKVVLHSGKEGAGLYYVYVKQDKNPYWYVNTNTGYATGV